MAVAKSRADYDDGIVNLKAQSIEVKSTELIHEEAGTGACSPAPVFKRFNNVYLTQYLPRFSGSSSMS